ncbi:hypothetical protein SAMN05443245_5201 [Paraburkholderia fungorum]|uniref:Uncharacterized protein n=1 Tax=Paraburkholderia fungorum TaxID=134537 RepID=A0A1H1IIU6_9BURK|nr:hypothetical protein SAMN05443245_5201 [Paraburkholderia fungorum]
MHRERLEQMVTMLRGLPVDAEPKFHLRTWNCGTTACAVGHACFYQPLIDQGLRWNSMDRVPEFEGEESWDAVRGFFGLGREDAEYLFYDECYPSYGEFTTAIDVADRIEQLIAGTSV